MLQSLFVTENKRNAGLEQSLEVSIVFLQYLNSQFAMDLMYLPDTIGFQPRYYGYGHDDQVWVNINQVTSGIYLLDKTQWLSCKSPFMLQVCISTGYFHCNFVVVVGSHAILFRLVEIVQWLVRRLYYLLSSILQIMSLLKSTILRNCAVSSMS